MRNREKQNYIERNITLDDAHAWNEGRITDHLLQLLREAGNATVEVWHDCSHDAEHCTSSEISIELLGGEALTAELGEALDRLMDEHGPPHSSNWEGAGVVCHFCSWEDKWATYDCNSTYGHYPTCAWVAAQKVREKP